MEAIGVSLLGVEVAFMTEEEVAGIFSLCKVDREKDMMMCVVCLLVCLEVVSGFVLRIFVAL